jgi:hypothetical protein
VPSIVPCGPGSTHNGSPASMPTFNLAPEKMASLILALPPLWATLQAELSAFADYLEALGR